MKGSRGEKERRRNECNDLNTGKLLSSARLSSPFRLLNGSQREKLLMETRNRCVNEKVSTGFASLFLSSWIVSLFLRRSVHLSLEVCVFKKKQHLNGILFSANVIGVSFRWTILQEQDEWV